MGSKVKLSTSFRPQTYGQAQHTIHILEDMSRSCLIDFKGNWYDHLPLFEFAYNHTYHSSIQMSPYEPLYGRRCTSRIGWFEVGEDELIRPHLVNQHIHNVKVIQRGLK